MVLSSGISFYQAHFLSYTLQQNLKLSTLIPLGQLKFLLRQKLAQFFFFQIFFVSLFIHVRCLNSL